MTLFTRYTAHVDAALDALTAAVTLPAGLDRRNVTVEPPRDATHGDLATNAAMVLAKPAGTNPRQLAEALAGELRTLDQVAAVTMAATMARVAAVTAATVQLSPPLVRAPPPIRWRSRASDGRSGRRTDGSAR